MSTFQEKIQAKKEYSVGSLYLPKLVETLKGMGFKHVPVKPPAWRDCHLYRHKDAGIVVDALFIERNRYGHMGYSPTGLDETHKATEVRVRHSETEKTFLLTPTVVDEVVNYITELV